MSIWFVSRHAGAVEWARQQGLMVDHLVSHLDPEQVQPGDTVVGSLPVHLAAVVCDRGARYMHLEMDVPQAMRGRELSAEEMAACNARLNQYNVEKEAGDAQQ